MEQSEVVRLRGAYTLHVMDTKGNIVSSTHVDNVVVTAGRRWVLQQVNSTDHATAQNLSHIAVGTSTTAPATSDTGLGSESSRVAINSNATGLTANPPSVQFQASWATNQANTTLGEVGIFNSSSGGTMLARATFSTLNKATSNTLAISYTISSLIETE